MNPPPIRGAFDKRLPNLPRKPFVPFEERFPEHTPTYTLERFIAEGKADPERWEQLNREWEEG